jgi:WD40 repeat protein
MPSYSSDEFHADWRYAIKEDFVTSTDQPYPYADNGHLQWGNEVQKIAFNGAAHLGCISNDGKRLALAIEHDIHVVDTVTWETVAILKGHTSQVNAISFRPDDANSLVSGETEEHRTKETISSPMIIFWNIEEENTKHPHGDDSYGGAAHAAATIAAESLTKFGISLDQDEIRGLEAGFQPVIDRAAARNVAARHATIDGRLQEHFQAQIFSPSGKWMVYLPGKSPRSNGNDQWHMQIISTATLQKKLLLKGHTDAIMWTGWSPDETFFASISWDRSIRIWDACTGDQKHCFMTETQNWTGNFSPDMSYFVATDGKGNLRVFSLPSGELHWMYEGQSGGGWRRTISWHPNNQWLALGGERLGGLLLLDVREKKQLQKRTLSADACTREDEYRKMMTRFVGVGKVQFLDGGNKLVVWTYGDGSIELYDIQQEVKWRFPRGGTDDGSEAHKWRDEKGKVTSKRGYGMVAWEDRSKAVLRMASLDFDGVRIWDVPQSQ